jgi:hypothetical protein
MVHLKTATIQAPADEQNPFKSGVHIAALIRIRVYTTRRTFL